MFDNKSIRNMSEEERLKFMNMFLKGQLDSENDDLANISNATAAINAFIDRINWAGFYFLRGDELVLGPFQGLPACNRIAIGSGVCGTAVATGEIQLVPNVHEFPGHIACDSASNSELVIPIIKDEKTIGVLDIDSPEKNRFTQLHVDYLVKFIEMLNEKINWEKI
ncbi:GAF domain-containing protein [Tissierella sp. Yu-01]|uniref:GAF domain-containing protein n=1 Tax=Tissierella sp. Yu-01 TaxID=3035694 RepID=UPI00240E658A|nr:GAF domain-containing protein [Tissierella sp. Yu-01]WFA09389.1 GAF domain-containing protein [Tissierella sp. Yu-01]